MLYPFVILLIVGFISFMVLVLKGEGGQYAEKDYKKKKNNPFDSFMI